ncbi:hypothetical protein B0H17DRAFT_1338698 [Mycena rosella]|uniref:Uncharacterized protein n=1 Tax=Mycena rosella TaxID=1033263 RepID=A0AAD7G186_MYCRO|nr:hypothetical protein B0H17DRAFT_1338698 [Mycena rosella]
MNAVSPAPVALVSAPLPLPTCNVCRKAPVTSHRYTSCLPCRDKRAEQKKRAKLRKTREQTALLKAGSIANIPAAVAGGDVKSLKRKAEDESSADAMERMRKRVKKMEVAKLDVPVLVSATDGFEKFVNAAELTKDLKRHYPDTLKITALRYHATYAIIADPAIDNKDRTRRVARDLRENTALHFSLEDRSSTRSSGPTNKYTLAYKCTCRASTALKRSGSDLSLYFGSTKKAVAPGDEKKSECRGKVEISAEDDTSHRFWLGQRVRVTVTHPKKA